MTDYIPLELASEDEDIDRMKTFIKDMVRLICYPNNIDTDEEVTS